MHNPSNYPWVYPSTIFLLLMKKIPKEKENNNTKKGGIKLHFGGILINFHKVDDVKAFYGRTSHKISLKISLKETKKSDQRYTMLRDENYRIEALSFALDPS
ncbi:535_t:CDS:2 [Funneliformis caledonium]|uniref:535_t:CDS:1 n=1 Tax=Funneliformis caledonium TaxID=1117310 RepID=A0A9N8VHY5_9GLOM|nr:535_t:CDS:2 [Funneliformis caledonium]